MTDVHLRILRLLAGERQRELDEHDAAGHAGGAKATDRRRELVRSAGRTRARVAAAEARRRYLRLTRGH